MPGHSHADITSHYASAGFGDLIEAWLRDAGKDLKTVSVADLAPVDQLHNGRLGATEALIRMAAPQPGWRVADLGGGLGGPARLLASDHGCDVTVVDLTQDFCEVGEQLTRLTRLTDRVHFRHGSALDTGLPAGTFDLVWMQNAAMNIEDRPSLYKEVARLLSPGGIFAFQEIAAGPVQPAYYPSGWATTASTSFLYAPDEVRAMLIAAGFSEVEFEDFTEASTEAQQQRLTTGEAGNIPSYNPPEVIILSAQNAVRSAKENRTRAIRGVYRAAG